MEVNLNKWHHCQVDKKEFVKLLEKSDISGFKHIFIFFSSLIVFGYLAFATWGTLWSFIFFFIYGNIYCCSDSIWHETGHKTAFKSRYWNNFFYEISSYMNAFEPVRWKWSHFRHHSHTAFEDPLDFEIPIRKPTDLFFFFTLFIPFGSLLHFKKSLHFETLKHALGIKSDVMKNCIPENEQSK